MSETNNCSKLINDIFIKEVCHQENSIVHGETTLYKPHCTEKHSSLRPNNPNIIFLGYRNEKEETDRSSTVMNNTNNVKSLMNYLDLSNDTSKSHLFQAFLGNVTVTLRNR